MYRSDWFASTNTFKLKFFCMENLDSVHVTIEPKSSKNTSFSSSNQRAEKIRAFLQFFRSTLSSQSLPYFCRKHLQKLQDGSGHVGSETQKMNCSLGCQKQNEIAICASNEAFNVGKDTVSKTRYQRDKDDFRFFHLRQ